MRSHATLNIHYKNAFRLLPFSLYLAARVSEHVHIHTHTLAPSYHILLRLFATRMYLYVHSNWVFCVCATYTAHAYIRMFLCAVYMCMWEAHVHSVIAAETPAIRTMSASWGSQLENCREFVWVRIASLCL